MGLNKSQIDESMVLQIVEKELEEKEKDQRKEYLELIEKIEGILNESEAEKQSLLDQLTDLNVRYESLTDNNQVLENELESMKASYDKLLRNCDLLSLEKTNLLTENDKLKKQLVIVENKKENFFRDILSNAEEQIKELSIKLEEITAERDVMKQRLESMVKAKNSSEDILSLQQLHLHDLEERCDRLSTENKKLNNNIQIIIKQKSKLESQLDSKNEAYDELIKQNSYEFERLNIENANRIKEIENDVLKERQRCITGLDPNLGPGLNFNFSSVGSYQQQSIPEITITEVLKKDSIARNKKSNGTDHIYLGSSRRNMLCIEELKQSKAELETSINFVDKLKQKDKEIAELREEILALKEKMKSKDVKEKEDQINELTLNLRHMEEQMAMLKERAEQEKLFYEKKAKEAENDYVKFKMKCQFELSERDMREVKMSKKIKLLTYHIRLYEEEIDDYNQQLEKMKK